MKTYANENLIYLQNERILQRKWKKSQEKKEKFSFELNRVEQYLLRVKVNCEVFCWNLCYDLTLKSECLINTRFRLFTLCCYSVLKRRGVFMKIFFSFKIFLIQSFFFFRRWWIMDFKFSIVWVLQYFTCAFYRAWFGLDFLVFDVYYI